MMMSEFIDLLHEVSPTHREPTDEEYKAIELVYTYHPSIGCKEDIVDLWRNYGNMIINDMLTRAEVIKEAEAKLEEAKRAYEKAKKRYNAVIKEDFYDVFL